MTENYQVSFFFPTKEYTFNEIMELFKGIFIKFQKICES